MHIGPAASRYSPPIYSRLVGAGTLVPLMFSAAFGPIIGVLVSLCVGTGRDACVVITEPKQISDLEKRGLQRDFPMNRRNPVE